MNNNLELRWDTITQDPMVPVFSLLDIKHPVRIYVGKSISGERLLLIITPSECPDQKDMKSIGLQKIKKENGEWSLLLKLKDPALKDVFSNLCVDIVEVSKRAMTAEAGVTLVMRRLNSWRKLLEVGGRDLLDIESVRGLFGELHFLLYKLGPEIGFAKAVKSWGGPLGSDQDFTTPEKAWEIKTIRNGAEKINIASEKQLSSHSNIILVESTLSEVDENENGISLNHMVEDVRNAIGEDMDASILFEEKISAAGFVFKLEYNTPLMKIMNECYYEVRKDFPRIDFATLKLGISCVTYKIDRATCKPFIVESFL